MSGSDSKRPKLHELRRDPRVEHIPIENIQSEPLEDDETFRHLYTKYLQGDQPAAITRLRANRILRGFVRMSATAAEHIQNDLVDQNIDLLVSHIRSGHRPTLMVYEIPSAPYKDAEFACPDDQPAFEAYRRVNISLVPVTILGGFTRPLDEPALLTHSYRTPDYPRETFVGIHELKRDSVESLLGLCIPEFDAGLDYILEAIEHAKRSIREFHQSTQDPIHYHHTLHSVLVRTKRAAVAMRLLKDNELYYEAVVILRSLYELFLSFYVDWLAPEFTGPVLHLASVLKESDWRRERKSLYDGMVANGLDEAVGEELLRGDARLYHLVTTAKEKARLSPIAQRHDEIYRYLSSVVHQDFSMTARYVHTLESLDMNDLESPDWARLLRLVDIIVAQMVARIRADVGVPQP